MTRTTSITRLAVPRAEKRQRASSRDSLLAARRFVVEALMNIAALGIIAAVATRIDVPQPFPFGSAVTPIIDLGPTPIFALVLFGT